MNIVTETKGGVLYGFHLESGPYRYVGITTKALSTRMNQHRWSALNGVKFPVYDWVRKHGWDSIIVEIISEHPSSTSLKDAEIALIAKLGRGKGSLLNLTGGGDGICNISKEARDSISARMMGRVASEQTRKRQSLAKSGGGAAGVGKQNRRVTEAEVQEIRSRLKAGRETHGEIGKRYGVSSSCVQNIGSRKSWSWLAEDSTHDAFLYTPQEIVDIDAEHAQRDAQRYAAPKNSPRGSSQYRAKLTEEDIFVIRDMLDQGQTLTTIGAQFGVTKSCISDIKRGKSWGWLAH